MDELHALGDIGVLYSSKVQDDVGDLPTGLANLKSVLEKQ